MNKEWKSKQTVRKSEWVRIQNDHLQSNSFLSLSLLLLPRGMVKEDELRLKFTSVFASVLALLNCNWWADWSANPFVRWWCPLTLELLDQRILLWSLEGPLELLNTCWLWLLLLEVAAGCFDSLKELLDQFLVKRCCCCCCWCCLCLELLLPLVIALTGTLLHCKVLIVADSLDCGRGRKSKNKWQGVNKLHKDKALGTNETNAQAGEREREAERQIIDE